MLSSFICIGNFWIPGRLYDCGYDINSSASALMASDSTFDVLISVAEPPVLLIISIGKTLLGLVLVFGPSWLMFSLFSNMK